MKPALMIAVMFLLVIGGLEVAACATISFEQSQVSFNPGEFVAAYADFELTAVGRKLLLGSKTYFVELHDNEELSCISHSVHDYEPLGSFDLEEALIDIPTGDSRSYAESVASAVPGAQLGSSSVCVVSERDRGDARYAVLLVFPVTVNQDGEACFNRTIDIFAGTRSIRSEELLTETQAYDCLSRYGDSFELSSAGSGVPNYIIVTAAPLTEPLEQLAEYKTSTGYRTEVVVIDDILASYSGRDDAEKLRNYLKDFHAEGGRYVLLGGDESLLPVRYAYHYSTNTAPGLERQQICDLYFADLTGEWDYDDDDIWGERVVDKADIIPEVRVGRLPFSTAGQAAAYVEKLIAYETAPGGNERSYLSRAFFFSSDQMRDYSEGGQHGRIAAAYPEQFWIDTANGVELTRGDDPYPHNAIAPQLIDILASGYGIINVIAHGRADGFVVRSSGYNDWPKSYFFTESPGGDHSDFDSLLSNGKPSLYYSLACDNGAFDMDSPPMGYDAPSVVEELLCKTNGGAVAFVGYSRWGWVGSSHLLQRAFFDSLFAHPDRPAVAAMYASKQRYYYYRDLVYGQNYFGDPTLRIYTDIPDSLAITIVPAADEVEARVTAEGLPVAGCLVVLSDAGGIISQSVTDDAGLIVMEINFSPGSEYVISAVKPGCTVGRALYTPSIVADADDDQRSVPATSSLSQNYPNPFNPTTTIAFSLTRRSSVNMSIYNVLGQKVTTLKNEILSAGEHQADWNGTDENGNDVSSGVYFYRLVTDESVDGRKMMMLR